MSRYFVQDVRNFQQKFGFTLPQQYTNLTDELHKFRAAFFDEELAEFIEGNRTKDIELAIDSIIDLLYICAGSALFHGLSVDEFYAFSDKREPEDNVYKIAEYSKMKPKLLKPENAQYAAECIDSQIKIFRMTHESHKMFDLAACKYKNLYALTGIWNSCMTIAEDMGIDSTLLCLLWDDVQRANMTKERATSATAGKRGSAVFDIIKPPGWVGPDTAAVIRNYYAS